MILVICEILEYVYSPFKQYYTTSANLKKLSHLCNSNYFGAYYIMGIILFEKNELNLAKAAFENVIKIKPNFKEVYSSLGKVYLAQGEHANGLKMIAKANGFIRFTSTSKINIIN